VTYRAELSDRVLTQLGDFPTSDPYVRRAEFGAAGLVTYVIDDARRTVTLTDVTWIG
jgi:hypothetical protein